MVTRRHGKREKVRMTSPAQTLEAAPALSSASTSSCPSPLSSHSQTSSSCSRIHSSTPPTSPLLARVEPHELTLEEKHHILSVLLKLDDLQNLENTRDRLVREEFCQSLDDLAATITSKVTTDSRYLATPNKYCCHICTEVIGRHRVKKERSVLVCWDCNQLTCDCCGVTQSSTGPFDNRFTNKTVRLCKPCTYRRDMTLKSGEWFYGAVGAQEVKNIHKSVIESLEIPNSDPKDEAAGSPNWKQKAQKKISRTSLSTLKVMKQKWQSLAKFKPNLTDSRDSVNWSSDEEVEKSRFAEEIQEQYLAFRGSRAACKYAKKTSYDQSSSSSTCSNLESKQWSRESSPERFSSSKNGTLSSWSMVTARTGTTPKISPSSIRRNRSEENLSPLHKLRRKNLLVSGDRKMSRKESLLEKWRTSAGSCSNIVSNTVNSDFVRNVMPLSSKSLL